MTTTTANELRTNLIGAWTLQSYETTSVDGSTTMYPLGNDAHGIIMYTPDGYMSAQIMRSQRTPFDRNDPHLANDDELAAAAEGYFHYAGPYTVDDDGDRPPRRTQSGAELGRRDPVPQGPLRRLSPRTQHSRTDFDARGTPHRQTRLAPRLSGLR